MTYTQYTKTIAMGSMALLATTSLAYAADNADPSSLLNMSLAELTEIEVTSVSKNLFKIF